VSVVATCRDVLGAGSVLGHHPVTVALAAPNKWARAVNKNPGRQGEGETSLSTAMSPSRALLRHALYLLGLHVVVLSAGAAPRAFSHLCGGGAIAQTARSHCAQSRITARRIGRMGGVCPIERVAAHILARTTWPPPLVHSTKYSI
jgi:hypothetical protein